MQAEIKEKNKHKTYKFDEWNGLQIWIPNSQLSHIPKIKLIKYASLGGLQNLN